MTVMCFWSLDGNRAADSPDGLSARRETSGRPVRVRRGGRSGRRVPDGRLQARRRARRQGGEEQGQPLHQRGAAALHQGPGPDLRQLGRHQQRRGPAEPDAAGLEQVRRPLRRGEEAVGPRHLQHGDPEARGAEQDVPDAAEHGAQPDRVALRTDRTAPARVCRFGDREGQAGDLSEYG